jgi:hypothetical protein
LAHPYGRYGCGVPRVPNVKPNGKPISAPLIATNFTGIMNTTIKSR